MKFAISNSFVILLSFCVSSIVSVPFPRNHPSESVTLTQISRPFQHGEGPHWDERNKRLYFVDLYVGRLHSLDPATGELRTLQFQGNTTAVFTVKGDTKLFVVANNRSLVAVKWNSNSDGDYRSTILGEVDKGITTNRCNDGKVDRNGRLWIGTMAIEVSPGINGVKANQGNVYRVNPAAISNSKPNLKPEVMIPQVTISNGIAWNRDNTVMYYIDTSSFKVVAYNFDLKAGTVDLDNVEVIFDFAADKRFTGGPDGMTIDRDDNIWVALYGGGCIVHINPNTKSVLQVIAIPSRYVTALIFGGDAFDTLYVTTSHYSLTKDEMKWQPAAGAIFAIKGVRSGYAGTHTNIISANGMAKTCKVNNDDLWCQDKN